MANNREIVQRVANILDIEKVAWSRAMQLCARCLGDGFTEEDIIQAAMNMKESDSRYWSIYSVFMKTDYWMSKSQTKAPKGVW